VKKCQGALNGWELPQAGTHILFFSKLAAEAGKQKTLKPREPVAEPLDIAGSQRAQTRFFERENIRGLDPDTDAVSADQIAGGMESVDDAPAVARISFQLERAKLDY
jgi:hypothetical protein